MANLSVPRKGLVGPWAHKYPHLGEPGPAIDFLQECLRFYDHCLKDADTGMMNEPMLRVWMQDSVRPSARYTVRPGRWVAAPSWPSPEPVKLTITPAASVLQLPVRPPRPDEDATLPAFGEPEAGPPANVTQRQPTQEAWRVFNDLANDLSTLEVYNDEGTRRFDDSDLEVAAHVSERYTHAYAQHDSLRAWCEWVRRFRRGDRETTVITRTLMTCDRDNFRVRATLDAYEGDTRVFAETWDRTLPRDLV